MPGLIVHDATEIQPRSLLLRAGAHSLTRNLDPQTAQPGDLPDSLVESVDQHDGGVYVAFRDGSGLELDHNDYCEAVI